MKNEETKIDIRKYKKKFENINKKKMKLNKTNLIQGENLNKQQIDHYTA